MLAATKAESQIAKNEKPRKRPSAPPSSLTIDSKGKINSSSCFSTSVVANLSTGSGVGDDGDDHNDVEVGVGVGIDVGDQVQGLCENWRWHPGQEIITGRFKVSRLDK